MMWLVVGGPALVVVASFITLSLAIRHPDPVLDTSRAQSADGDVQPDQWTPAVRARNHAATAREGEEK